LHVRVLERRGAGVQGGGFETKPPARFSPAGNRIENFTQNIPGLQSFEAETRCGLHGRGNTAIPGSSWASVIVVFGVRLRSISGTGFKSYAGESIQRPGAVIDGACPEKSDFLKS